MKLCLKFKDNLDLNANPIYQWERYLGIDMADQYLGLSPTCNAQWVDVWSETIPIDHVYMWLAGSGVG